MLLKSMKSVIVALAVSAASALGAPLAAACGPDTDCVLGDRRYRIYLPAGLTAPFGAVVYAHGHGGTAAGVMANGSLRAMADRLGVALIALKSSGRGWRLPSAPGAAAGEDGRIELDYVDDVLDDALRRFDIDPSRVMASGFSSGAMMVWHIACRRPERFAGFAPIAGVFWRPIPDDCASAFPNIFHVHGTSDRVVPLEGRAIGAARQGDVPETIAMAAAAGGYVEEPERYVDGRLECARRSRPDGALLEFCLHDGAHDFRPEYLERAWRALEASGAL